MTHVCDVIIFAFTIKMSVKWHNVIKFRTTIHKIFIFKYGTKIKKCETKAIPVATLKYGGTSRPSTNPLKIFHITIHMQSQLFKLLHVKILEKF